MNKKVAIGTGVAIAIVGVLVVAQFSLFQRKDSLAETRTVAMQPAPALVQAHRHLDTVIDCLESARGAAPGATSNARCAATAGVAITKTHGNAMSEAELVKALAIAKAGATSTNLATVDHDTGQVSALLKTATVRENR